MSNKPDLVSIQGEMFAALITSGVAGPFLSMGNAPDITLAISSESTDHFDSRFGFRAKDATLRKATGVSVNLTLEEVNKQNKEILFSGKTTSTTSTSVADISLGSVTVGEMINLGRRNLSSVIFKSGSTTVEAETYVLDATFGTVIFNTAPASPVTWSGTVGVVEKTTIATNLGREYALLFKGVDTHSGDKVVAELWRVQFSPETEFALINEDFGSYSISGESLADLSKANDPQFGPFGVVEQFNITP